ncbi:helix-turn-helix transcriptional regulator [Ruegeria conchae]|uniref:Putative DNA-binding transcriptional regulator YafY n=1 Tax=Ruegeria conchae TaxID=981384 RepID=A0A497ZSP6_9RHOB|nr:WYL domain-containing protein [Ruegeria conchae]RLK07956.1 putative DNA-binding transcriptional regulator YafY [Ruegeria conchae]
MKSSRLLSILLRLQSRGLMTAQQLADEFEVSLRTIHRDIDQLSYAGVPVYAERGRNGGYRLMDGYQTRLTGLDADEARSLLLAGLGSALDDLGLLEAASQTELKIMASLSGSTRDQAILVSERFLLDPLGWYQKKTTAPFVPEVASAVWNERRLSIEYESWNGVVDRVVSPLAIVLKAGNWYLVALFETPRVYKIANVRSIKVLDETFLRPKTFDVSAFWHSWIADFERRLKSQQVALRVSSTGLRMLNELGFVLQSPVQIPKRKGWFSVNVHMEVGVKAVRDVLSLGSEAEVHEPAAFREDVIAEARRVIDLYVS